MKKNLKNFEECKEYVEEAVNKILEAYIHNEKIVFPKVQFKVKLSKVEE